MKRIFYLILLFCGGFLHAQGNGADLIFPQYQEGVAILKDGTQVKAYYNYSMLRKQIQYLDDKGIVMTFSHPQVVSTVTIGDRIFENTPKHRFLERVSIGDGYYYIDWDIKLVSVGKKAGYGHLSQTAASDSYILSGSQPEAPTSNANQISWTYLSNNYGSSPQSSINGMLVQHDDGMQAFPNCSYFMKIDGQFKRFDSANSLAKVLGCCKEELKAFVKEEKINFKNPQDVHRMMMTFLARTEKQ